jgi:F-type H+-transporting ATPase subunit gamma
MNMVSAAKLRGSQTRMEQFRPYAGAFKQMLASIASRVEPEAHPFFNQAENVQKVELVLMTADRGLCGSFNMNLINAAEKFIKQKKAEGIEVVLTTVGRKGRDYFRRRKYDIRNRKWTSGISSIFHRRALPGCRYSFNNSKLRKYI